MDITPLKEQFEAIFGRPAEGAVRAPGRVNLIGEHTDYNGGFVLPIAIERETAAVFARRSDRTVRFSSRQQEQADEISLEAPIVKGGVKWANYPRGVAAQLAARGIKLAGMDILFHSNVPLGGGLSSSASLEVATGLAMLAAAGAAAAVAPYDLALLCQKAEHEFAGTPCGIMDQAISVMGRAGHALRLDCRSGEVKQIPFHNSELVLLVADTQVKHALNDGGYAARRDQCFAAARKMGVAQLRDAQLCAACSKTIELTEKEQMRARHVIGEIRRTLQACEALERNDYAAFGELMYESHASLRDDYEVSCAELDCIVEIARGQQGVLGARMTGGGFGGCAIVLANRRRAEQIEKAIQDGFEKSFGARCPIFATGAADGAGEAR